MLTLERLKELLIYDLEDGSFINRRNRGHVLAGAPAGALCLQGYIQIQIDGCIYKAHRLAWFYIYGDWPSEIDHINGDRQDNRLCNLREVSRSQNNANAERPVGIAGLRGVTWFARDRKWKAQIKVSGQSVHLGYYDTIEQAHAAFLNAADNIHGEYAYHNRPREV